ncbi:MAG: DUF1552 domain-containing protein, partial [Myxococcota bacterium]
MRIDSLRFAERSRRFFLKAAGASVALPFLPSLTSDALAQSMDFRRVVFFVFNHGVAKPLWQPRVSGSQQVAGNVRVSPLVDAQMATYFGSSLAGLERKVSFLEGLGITGAVGGHYEPAALTCSPLRSQDGGRPGTRPDSIDAILGRHIYGRAPAVPVLRLNHTGGNNMEFCYENFRKLPSFHPSAAYARLFPNGVTPPSNPQPPSTGGGGVSVAELQRQQRLARLRTTIERFQSVIGSPSLSSRDSEVLEQSLDRYVDLERGLAEMPDVPEVPTLPPSDACQPLELNGSTNRDQLLEMNSKLLVQAFACNATRLAAWKLGSDHSDNGAHKANSSSNVDGSGVYTRTIRDNVRQVATVLRAMDEVVEANGATMLDNSLVVFTSDMSSSTVPNHGGVDAPVMLAGGLGGRFKMGEVIDYRDRDESVARKRIDSGDASAGNVDYFAGPPTNELMISIMREFGLGPSEWES